jgi:hypothetical protein
MERKDTAEPKPVPRAKSSICWVMKQFVYFRRPTKRFIPADRTLHNHSFENFKSYIVFLKSLCLALMVLF